MSNVLHVDSETVGNGSRRGETGPVGDQAGDSPSRDWDLMGNARSAAVLFLLLTLITGIIYPVVITVVAAVVFPGASNGSLIQDGDGAAGSELVGQPFDDVRYFWGRPSATAPAYNGLGGSGSNQATTNPALLEAVRERIDRLKAASPDNSSPIPVELVTASASGLDPHLSPAAVHFQAWRISRVRGIPLEKVNELIKAQTEPPTLGFFGQPRVNVLKLNRSLDANR